MRGGLCLALALALGALTSLAAADGAASEGEVSARFVTAADAAGRVVGVELTMAPGWHVYWRHPGEAGLATEVRFELPPGVATGAVEWPLPIRFDSPGGITSYGYPERVVLAAPVTAASAGAASANLTVDVSWLACKKVCVLGEARVAGRLGEDSAGFDLPAWRSSLPRAQAPFGVRVTGGLEPGTRRATPMVWLSFAPRDALEQVELFPVPGADLKVTDVRASRRGSLVRVDLRATRLGAGDHPLRLPAVVAFTMDGRRRGYEIVLPLGRDMDAEGE